MAKETKQVRLILPNEIVELEGTPEELAEQIQSYSMVRLDNVIPFPPRGMFAHPSNPDWK